MKSNIEDSETMKEVTDEMLDDTDYSDPTLLMSTSSARVYKMRSGGKTICIKVPVSTSGLHLDMLKREFKIGAMLSHPGIVGYLKWEATSPVGPGILLEYVDGCRLGDFLRENPSLDMRLRIFDQILDAVEYLHRCGVVHNDIKPSNIMVSRVSHSVKLIDFGFADNDANTLQRVMGGTLGYASPELVEGDTSTDARSDIYALGVVMQDIFGRRFSRVARCCLNSDPAKRYRSVAELRRAWRRSLKRPRVAMIAALFVLLAGSIVWNIAARHDSTLAARRADSTIARLNDSILRLNSHVSSLNSQVADLDHRELERIYRQDRFNTLKTKYEAGADSLAQAMAYEMHKCHGDLSSLLTLLGEFNDRFDSYTREFVKQNQEGADEIVEIFSSQLINKTYTSVYASYQEIYDKTVVGK